jgi:hypothetical protein
VSTKTAWDLGPVEWESHRADRETRISDFLLFALLPLAGIEVGGLPVNELATLALVFLAVWRTPARVAPTPLWLLGLLGLVVGLLFLSAQLNDIDANRRLVHLVGFAGLTLALASGRVSLLSAARGMALSLAVCTAYGAATISQSSYEGRLTGIFSDPNVAALLLTTLGAVSVPHLQRRWLRRALVLTIAVGVVLTFSRTGLVALGLGGLWLLVGRRLAAVPGAALTGAAIYGLSHLPRDLALLGAFDDRTGSDALRSRIIAEERLKLADMPWYGNGPGTSSVQLQDLTFFFHNSYLGARNEGGWVVLVAVVAGLVGAFLLLHPATRRGETAAPYAQAGIIAVLVLAVSLGEVLLDLPTAAVLGFAVATALAAERRRPPG